MNDSARLSCIGQILLSVIVCFGCLFALLLKYFWFRVLYEKMALANRDITLDIDEKDKSYMRKFTLVRSISTISEERASMLSVAQNRMSVSSLGSNKDSVFIESSTPSLTSNRMQSVPPARQGSVRKPSPSQQPSEATPTIYE